MFALESPPWVVFRQTDFGTELVERRLSGVSLCALNVERLILAWVTDIATSMIHYFRRVMRRLQPTLIFASATLQRGRKEEAPLIDELKERHAA